MMFLKLGDTQKLKLEDFVNLKALITSNVSKIKITSPMALCNRGFSLISSIRVDED